MQSIKKAFKAIGNGFFNNLVERSIKVYIQKHLGEFLLHKLSTDQVDVGLDGGSFASLYLDPETINSRLESINAPFTLVEGYVDIVHLMIPWQQLPSKSIIVEIDGLILTVRLTEEEQDDGMDVKSMLDSMSASMVEEMLKSKEANGDIEQIADGGKGATPYETVEFMSDFITSIMTRIQVKLENVNIMVEKSPGIQVDLTIDRLHVYDEQSVSAQWKRDNGVPEAEGFSTKIVEVSNVAVYVVEMPSQKPDPPQTMDQDQYSAAAFNIAMSSPPNSGSYMTNSSMTQSFYPGMDSSQLFPQEQQQQKQKTISVSERMQQRIKCRIPIVNMDKKQMLFIQTKNNEQLSGPSVDVTWTMETLHVLLSPKLLGLLTEMLGSKKSTGRQQGAVQEPMTLEDFAFCRKFAEEDSRQNSLVDHISVPQLSTTDHIELMHGASSASMLSDNDMFYSTVDPTYKGQATGFDISDTASVSTFAGHSTFTSSNVSGYSHAKRNRERSASLLMEDHSEDSKVVNLTIPFFTVTVLMEEPKSDPFALRSSSSLHQHLPSVSSEQEQPKSFTAGDQSPVNIPPTSPRHASSLPVNVDSKSVPSPPTHTSFSNKAKDGQKNNSESSDDEEEFHDSGDYFEKCVDGRTIDSPPCGKADQAKTAPPTISHSDSMATSSSAQPSQVTQEPNSPECCLKVVADRFFLAMAELEARSSLRELRDKVSHVLPLDHLGLLSKPVQLNINQLKKSLESRLEVKVRMGKLEVVECLFDRLDSSSNFAKQVLPKVPQYSMLLTFDVNGLSDQTHGQFDPQQFFASDKHQQQSSALTLSVDSIKSRRRRKEVPALKVSLDFGKMTSEVDITIIDRLAPLLAMDTGRSQGPGTKLLDESGQLEEVIQEESSSVALNINTEVKAAHSTLRLRFPIPDLRVNPPPPSREDWCRRSLHKEMLVLELEAPEVRTSIKGDDPCKFELEVFKASAYMQEDIDKDPVLFGEVTVEDDKATAHDAQHFNWPRIVIGCTNKRNSELETEEESDHSNYSSDLYTDLLHSESGPFSKKKSFYERDDLSFSEQAAPDSDKMVMPGDILELRQFREECVAHTEMSVDINIPRIIVSLHSKEFLELLYNRFNNDLLMWEPKPLREHSYSHSLAPSTSSLGVLHLLQQQHRHMISSIDNELPESEEEEESMKYSIHDHAANHSGKQIKPTAVRPMSKLCFSLGIGSGIVFAVIPHPDAVTERGLHAEMCLTVRDGMLFSVNKHCGDPELKYLTLQAHRAHLYHNSHVTSPVQAGSLNHLRHGIPEQLRPRIYRSERWVSDRSQGRAGWGGDSPDMLALVVKTKVDTINNIKNFTLALRVDGATLRHEMHRTGESWVSQAMDLFDLTDFPILGYTVPKVMTEIHLQIDHCSVDYRPINLPVWSFLTMEHFSLCSNIVAESTVSKIQLRFDDGALFLSKKCNREVNLLKDYVCVGEVDQLKIWLQFSYSRPQKQKIPKTDMRFMCNQLMLHTCADSARALVDLIQYLVRDGDLGEEDFEGDADSSCGGDETQSIAAQGEETELQGQAASSCPVVPALTPEQEASVVSALEEAMNDSQECSEGKAEPVPERRPKGPGTRVFFQYDGSQVPELEQHLSEALHITTSNSSGSDDNGNCEDDGNEEEEFEIVDYHSKEIRNVHGSHKIFQLSPHPPEVVENYLPKPTSSFDILRSPEGFPDPEYQYTLRELSLVWRLYGGSDFGHQRRGSSAERIGLSRGMQSPRSQRKTSDADGSPRNSWRRRGGELRNFDLLMEFDLNKIRFRYEVYPTWTIQSSRFKFLVNSFELRDRIVASEVNKFLVKLVDKDHPEQNSAYMLMFSGVFKRPEHLPHREELEVKLFLLPIKLNIDQLALNFLKTFIQQLSESEMEPSSGPPPSGSAVGGRASPLGGRASPSGGRVSPISGRASPRASVGSADPIMQVREPSTKESSMDETELLMQFDEFSMKQSIYLQARLNENVSEVPQEDLPVFIKSFVFISDVTIKLDYRGKHCDMAQGVMGMMLGVASLTGSVVTLKHINCQKGILGWDKLIMYAANEWLNDIRSNQIHSILRGVGSFSIVCQIIQGMMDLIRLPIQQYQKDRRIIRGLQRGANSFTLNTVMAILELTNKVVGSIQYCAELGYDMMSPGPSVRRRRTVRHRNRQPRTTAEGAKAALQVVTEGVKESASNLSAMVSEESAHKGYVGVVGGTLRNATPECLFKPLALLAEAGSSLVQGVRNEVDPNVMKEEEDRWKQA